MMLGRAVRQVVTAATDAHDARLGQVQIMMFGGGGVLGCNCGAHDAVRLVVTEAADAHDACPA